MYLKQGRWLGALDAILTCVDPLDKTEAVIAVKLGLIQAGMQGMIEGLAETRVVEGKCVYSVYAARAQPVIRSLI
jgi:hypothetical protein